MYAPTTDWSDEDTETFYSKLEATIAKIPKKDIKIIQGDWNAKIGTNAHKNWAGTTGKIWHWDYKRKRCASPRIHKNARYGDTRFRHKISRRTTWTSLDVITKNQIDYIMVDKKCAGSINGSKARAFPGADIGSDHNLVMMIMKLKLKKIPKPEAPRVKYNIDRLRDRAIRESYQVKLGGRFAPLLELTDDTQDMTDLFTNSINATALEVLGKAKKV